MQPFFNPDNFIAQHGEQRQPNANDYVFLFSDHRIALMEQATIPTYSAISQQCNDNALWYCFGELAGKSCLLAPLGFDMDVSTFNLVSSRGSHQYVSDELFSMIGFASHLYHWRRQHRYCGQCSHEMIDKEDERARLCLNCKFVAYPKLSPCIIVLVKKGEQILLARSPHFKEGVYSAIAGFVEPGETVEQAVHRELMEEVGIAVKNLQYTCSQPWPFPDSLMLGYIAEYSSGEIEMDPVEIEDANWFSKNDLPNLPSTVSIARYLIEEVLFS